MGRIWDLERFGAQTALIDEFGNRLTYGELDAQANRLAQSVGRRCLVFSLCRNEIGSVLGYVAFINNGIVPVLLNSHLEEALLDDLLANYEPAYLWAPADQAGQFPGMEAVYEAHGYALLKTGYSKEYPLYPELGLLLTTSGSTGSPKFVRQSYENVLDNARSIVQYLELDETERPITTLPMNYTYRLFFQYRFPEHPGRIGTDATFFYCEKDTPYQDVAKWGELIDGRLAFHELGENHFFINHHYEAMARVINRTLSPEVST